jgi:hypothetical protein
MMGGKLKDADRRGQHPNSQKNLTHEGRPSSEEIYGEPKQNRTVTVTNSGWEGIKEFVKAAGYKSPSEFLELLGRGVISVPEKPKTE